MIKLTLNLTQKQFNEVVAIFDDANICPGFIDRDAPENKKRGLRILCDKHDFCIDCWREELKKMIVK